MWKCKFLRHTFNSKSRVAEEEAARSPEKSNIASSPVSCVTVCALPICWSPKVYKYAKCNSTNKSDFSNLTNVQYSMF